MKQKVLITGASGFVGFHLIEAALNRGLEVYAAIRKSSIVDHLKSFDISYTELDFRSVESLKKDINEKQYDFIVHAAGTTKAKNLEEYNLVNASYTENLALAAVASGVEIKKLVFMSSLASIGPLSEGNQLINEQTIPRPVTAYGKSKLLAEEKLQQIKLPVVALRPTAVYGSRDKDIFIILKTFNNGFEPYIGSKAQDLSFVYVKDLARVSLNALYTSDEANGAYNITDGKCYDRYELANITKKVLDKQTLKFHLPVPFVKGLALVLEKSYGLFNKTPVLNLEKLNELTAANWCCDISKANKYLDFNPKYDLQKGLIEALEWYKENKWL